MQIYNSMQVATLNYEYNPKGDFHSDSKSKFQYRHILTIIKDPSKQTKQQQQHTPLSDTRTNSNEALPPIQTTSKQPSSIRIKGSGLQTSKLTEASVASFHQSFRSRSRQSDKSDIQGAKSRPITPSGKSTSRLINLKFGHPVKIRSAAFYAPDLPDSALRLREESFVNDSIRTDNQTIRSAKYPQYEPLNDPNLKQFFQSPLVLEVVRKTLNIDLDERPSDTRKQSRIINDRDTSYQRIVSKPSSGYGKLNGYDCLGSFSPLRHPRSIRHDQFQSSTNTSLANFPTFNSKQVQQKIQSRSNIKSKRTIPIATSYSLRQKPVATNDRAVASNVSQD